MAGANETGEDCFIAGNNRAYYVTSYLTNLGKFAKPDLRIAEPKKSKRAERRHNETVG